MVEILVWVLLYATPGHLPISISMYETKAECEAKARMLTDYYDNTGHPDYRLFCVRKTLGDMAKENK